MVKPYIEGGKMIKSCIDTNSTSSISDNSPDDDDDGLEMDRILSRLENLRKHTWYLSEKARRISARFFDIEQVEDCAEEEPSTSIVRLLDHEIDCLINISKRLEADLNILSSL